MFRHLTLALMLLALFSLTSCGGRGKDGSVIQNKGSDTLVNVAQAWAEAYKTVNPAASVAVSGGGSGTGFSALLNGTVDLANASRKMKAKEIAAAKAKGIDPVEFVVGFDALAVFVHMDNPKDRFTLAELAEIYGEGGKTTSWKDIGVEIPGCPSNEIVRVSRQNSSGTYFYFKKVVLGNKRDYALGSRDMHGSKDVVDLVENTPCAIGYSGMAYATKHLKMAAIAKDENSPYIKPTIETASDGTYPIARPLLMYTNGQPTGELKKYLDWILGPEGQKIIVDKDYAPAVRPDLK